jgi:hypothetical protein
LTVPRSELPEPIKAGIVAMINTIKPRG